MAEPAANPRRRFQLHLSTCIIVMIVAGVLLGLNLDKTYLVWRNGTGTYEGPDYDLGWPFYFYGNYGLVDAVLVLRDSSHRIKPEPSVWESFCANIQSRKLPFGLRTRGFDPGIRWREFAVNLVLWLMMLGLPAYLSEAWIRRRKCRPAEHSEIKAQGTKPN